MSALVIPIGSVPRSSLTSSREEARMEGFKRALDAIDSLKDCSMRQRECAIRNWEAVGLLRPEEARALAGYYGWERAP
jgi:hypothetical protein